MSAEINPVPAAAAKSTKTVVARTHDPGKNEKTCFFLLFSYIAQKVLSPDFSVEKRNY